MIPRTALCLLAMTLAVPAFAQTTEALPTAPAPAADAPAVTAPTAPPPIVELRDPREETRKAAPREQVFISPSGEPFRAPLNQPYPLAQWFARADANRDGVLTADEFSADQLSFFAVLDADRSGVVDGFESSAYEKTIAPEVAAEVTAPRRRRGGFLGIGGGRPRETELQGAAYYGVINEPLPIRAADANLDFKISRDEAIAAATRRFALLDLDKDGRIALAELPQTRAERRAGKPRG